METHETHTSRLARFVSYIIAFTILHLANSTNNLKLFPSVNFIFILIQACILHHPHAIPLRSCLQCQSVVDIEEDNEYEKQLPLAAPVNKNAMLSIITHTRAGEVHHYVCPLAHRGR